MLVRPPARPLVAALALSPLLSVPLQAQAPAIDPAGLPGTRVLVGGGRAPAAVYERFLALAGGKEKARIVLIPTASGSVDDPKDLDEVLARWRRDHDGYTFELLHTRDRGVADSEEFTAPLRAATKGEWTTLDIPLSCFAGAGADMRQVTAPLSLTTDGTLDLTISRARLVQANGAGTACPNN